MDAITRVKICLLLLATSAGTLLAMELTGFSQSLILSTLLKVIIISSFIYCAIVMLSLMSGTTTKQVT